MPDDNQFDLTELSKHINTDALMKIISESNHVQQAQQEHFERLINNNAARINNFKNPMDDIVEQFKVANEINTELKNQNLKLREEIIKFQEKPKRWYHKIAIWVWALIVFVLGGIVTSIIENIISGNFNAISQWVNGIFT